MRQRAFDARVPVAWVTGASVYGAERRRRGWWAERAHAEVWAVSGTAEVWRGWQQPPGTTVVATRPPDGGTRRRAGAGTKGRRWEAWRGLPLAPPLPPAWRRWLLIRRRGSALTDLTASVVFAPHASALETVVRVAGSRWSVESGVAAAQGEGGLEQ